MTDRHAYLIMAKNDFGVLTELLRELDYEKNDIFLHVDLKTGDFPLEELKSVVTKANFFPVSRMNVNWAGYSQIACELHLLEQATASGGHRYYHLLTGATFPVVSQEKIHSYFAAHLGEEFIGFCSGGNYLYRVYCYNLFNELGKPRTAADDRKIRLRELCNAAQMRLHMVYPPAKGINIKKGFAYWSLTQDAVDYVLSQKSWIKKAFRHSICGDEVFMQTILYNSPFAGRIHNPNDEFESCLRYVKPPQSWNENFGTTAAESSAPENGISVDDVEDILKSDRLFALKFVGDEGLEAIKYLKNLRNKF